MFKGLEDEIKEDLNSEKRSGRKRRVVGRLAEVEKEDKMEDTKEKYLGGGKRVKEAET
jgi:hypothetical protein